jgi:hypothetical protein
VPKRRTNAMIKTSMPEISCRNPSATLAPKCWAKTAVRTRRKIFTVTAMGIAEKKRTHLLTGRSETI